MVLNNIILLGCFCNIEIRKDDTAGGGCLVSTFHKCTFRPIEQWLHWIEDCHNRLGELTNNTFVGMPPLYHVSRRCGDDSQIVTEHTVVRWSSQSVKHQHSWECGSASPVYNLWVV